jgi:hypothetical protein
MRFVFSTFYMSFGENIAMKRILLIVTIFICYTSFAQRNAVKFSAGPVFNFEKNPGIYLLGAGPLLGKRISLNASIGYIKFREDHKGFIPLGADLTIHSFYSKKKVVPMFIFSAYYPFYTGRDDGSQLEGEFMGRLGVGGLISVTKNIKLGLSGNYMPFFTKVKGPNFNSTQLRDLYSVSAEVMFMKLR